MLARILIAWFGFLAAGCFTQSPSGGDAGDASSDVVVDGGVAAIFATSCALDGCHTGVKPPQNLDLSANAWYENLVGVASAEVFGEFRVQPGNATDTGSYLLCKVDPECVAVGDRMPLDGGLASDQIAMIRAWIASLPPGDASAPNYGADATPPIFAGANAAVAGPSSITLAWSPANDDKTASADLVYAIYESTSPGGETFTSPTAVTPRGAASFAIGKLAITTTHYFVVRARDLAGNEDANAIEVNATTPASADTTPPAFAGAAAATTQSPSAVAIGWSAATDAVSTSAQISYLVFSSTTSGAENFSTPDYVTLAGATSVAATGLAGGTKYFFVVRAQDQAGNVDTNTVELARTTSPVSFATDVWPLLHAPCTTAGCHTGAHPAEGINLDTPTNAYGSFVSITSSQCSSMSIVTPSSSSSSYLLQKLRGYGSCFVGLQMPEFGTPLTSDQIDLVGAWIGAGAMND